MIAKRDKQNHSALAEISGQRKYVTQPAESGRNPSTKFKGAALPNTIGEREKENIMKLL